MTWYQQTCTEKQFYKPLENRRRCRIVVVGGGLAGISTAVSLMEKGETDVVLLDAKQPMSGASGRNGGFVFAGYSRSPAWLLRKYGHQRAAPLYALTLEGMDRIRKRTSQYGLDARIHNGGVLLANVFHDERLKKLQQDLRAIQAEEQQWIAPEALVESMDTEAYADGLLEANAYHFHPLNYGLGLVRVLAEAGVAVHGDTPVTRITRKHRGWTVHTSRAELECEQVVVCGGGYQPPWKPAAIRKAVLPISTWITVTAPVADLLPRLFQRQWAVYDTRFAFAYYRPLPDGRLLWGGGIQAAALDEKRVREQARREMSRYYPQLAGVEIEQSWWGWMSYARHQMPQVLEYQPGFWVAQGFGGHGMATTAAAGEVLARAVSGDRLLLELFAPFALKSAGGMIGGFMAQAMYHYYQLRDRFQGA